MFRADSFSFVESQCSSFHCFLFNTLHRTTETDASTRPCRDRCSRQSTPSPKRSPSSSCPCHCTRFARPRFGKTIPPGRVASSALPTNSHCHCRLGQALPEQESAPPSLTRTMPERFPQSTAHCRGIRHQVYRTPGTRHSTTKRLGCGDTTDGRRTRTP